jgi:hypothetical protein
MIYRRDRNIHSIIFYEIVKTTIYQGQLKRYKMTDLSYFNCILKSLHVDLLMASSTSILMSNEKKNPIHIGKHELSLQKLECHLKCII